MKRVGANVFRCESCDREVQAVTGKTVAAALDLATFQPVFRTIARVPIVMAGVEYQLSTGPATFTPEDVQEFVASQDDPAIVPPRLKIGHTSVLSTNEAMGLLNDGDDGAPALGKVINIDYDPLTMSAVGDYVGVPGWLASILPIAYPNRSIEGFQEAQTVTGHTWGLVVQAVALLGVVWPGCSTLEDLPLLYGEEPPPGLEVVDEDGQEVDVTKAVAASRRPAAATTPVAAAVNVDDVRRAYYGALDSAQYWWWIRAIYIDPNELIVDDDEGQLYRVAFTINGDAVEFDDPAEVKIQYVDAASSPQSRQLRAALASALAADPARISASFNSREDSRSITDPHHEEGTMNPQQLRAAIGLPATASDAEVQARLRQLNAAAEEGTPPAETPPAEPAEEEEPEETPPTATTPLAETPEGEIDAAVLARLRAAGLSVVPTTQFETVAQQAQEGARVAAQSEESRRDSTINSALRAGRIRPADVASMQNLHASAATRDLFYTMLTAAETDGGLREGLVPIEERGETGDGATPGSGSAGTATDASYDPSWLNAQEQTRIAAVKGGTYQPPRVEADDPRVQTAA